ncbi:hypothetical protein Tco_1524869 [Tanacetum coccineum]
MPNPRESEEWDQGGKGKENGKIWEGEERGAKGGKGGEMKKEKDRQDPGMKTKGGVENGETEQGEEDKKGIEEKEYGRRGEKVDK